MTTQLAWDGSLDTVCRHLLNKCIEQGKAPQKSAQHFVDKCENNFKLGAGENIPNTDIRWSYHRGAGLGVHFGKSPLRFAIEAPVGTSRGKALQAVIDHFSTDLCDKFGGGKPQAVPASHSVSPSTKVDDGTTQAFWTTAPFQILGTAQQLGRDLDAAAKSPLVAPIIGAAAFLGLTAGAISQLRFGNTAPLQRLTETL